MNLPIDSASALAGFWIALDYRWLESRVKGTYMLRFGEDGLFGIVFRSNWYPSDADPSRADTELASLMAEVMDDPAIWGEYWFEEGLLCIQDAGNRIANEFYYWPECNQTGRYQVFLMQPDVIDPRPMAEPCSCSDNQSFPGRRQILGKEWQRVALTTE
jgi:hypothetical protein